MNETAKLLGLSLRETEDQLTRDMLASTAAFINSVGGFNGDNPTEITRSDCNDVIRTLRSNDAIMMMNHIEGDLKFGTGPVRDAFMALCSTELIADLNEVDGFITKNNYPRQDAVLQSEEGTVSNLRFMVSSKGSVTLNASALGNDVYNVFCVGLESYACVEQDGYSAQFIYRPAIFSDAAAQNITCAWKAAMVPRILNDEWLLNLRCTLSL